MYIEYLKEEAYNNRLRFSFSSSIFASSTPTKEVKEYLDIRREYSRYRKGSYDKEDYESSYEATELLLRISRYLRLYESR